VAPQLEHYANDRGKVTAGLPSLSPEKRRAITETQLRYLYQKALQRDAAEKEAAALADDGTIETTDWEQVVGIPLYGHQIIKRLKKLNSNLWFEVSHAAPDQMGIYLLKNDFKGGQVKEFLCGMQTDLSPEFSLRIKNEDGTAKGIISGWRRLLMRLIRKNIITESGAYAMFGPPSRASENWARFTT